MKLVNESRKLRAAMWLTCLMFAIYGLLTTAFLPLHIYLSDYTVLNFFVTEDEQSEHNRGPTKDSRERSIEGYPEESFDNDLMGIYLKNLTDNLEGVSSLAQVRSYSLNKKHIISILLEEKPPPYIWQFLTNTNKMRVHNGVKEVESLIRMSLPTNAALSASAHWPLQPNSTGLLYKLRPSESALTFERNFFKTIEFARENLFYKTKGKQASQSNKEKAKPAIKILIDSQAMKFHNLEAEEVLNSLDSALEHLPPLPLKFQNKIMPSEWKNFVTPGEMLSNLLSLGIERKTGEEIQLSQVASLEWKRTPEQIDGEPWLKKLEKLQSKNADSFWGAHWSSLERAFLFSIVLIVSILATIVSGWNLRNEALLILSTVLGTFLFLPILPLQGSVESAFSFTALLFGVWGTVRYTPVRVLPRFFFLPPVFSSIVFGFGVSVCLIIIAAHGNKIEKYFPHNESQYSRERKESDLRTRFTNRIDPKEVILEKSKSAVSKNFGVTTVLKEFRFPDFNVQLASVEKTEHVEFLTGFSYSKGLLAPINKIPAFQNEHRGVGDAFWLCLVFSTVGFIYFIYLKTRQTFLVAAAAHLSASSFLFCMFADLIAKQFAVISQFDNCDLIGSFVPGLLIASLSVFSSIHLRHDLLRKSGRDSYSASLMISRNYQRLSLVLFLLVGATWPIILLQESRRTIFFVLLSSLLFAVSIPCYLNRVVSFMEEEFNLWRLFIKIRIINSFMKAEGRADA